MNNIFKGILIEKQDNGTRHQLPMKSRQTKLFWESAMKGDLTHAEDYPYSLSSLSTVDLRYTYLVHNFFLCFLYKFAASC